MIPEHLEFPVYLRHLVNQILLEYLEFQQYPDCRLFPEYLVNQQFLVYLEIQQNLVSQLFLEYLVIL